MKTKVVLSFLLVIFATTSSFAQEKSQNRKAAVTEVQQADYKKITGTYKALKGDSEIVIDSNNNGLLYKFPGKPALVLKPVGQNLFRHETSERKLEFEFISKDNLVIITEKGIKKTYKKV